MEDFTERRRLRFRRTYTFMAVVAHLLAWAAYLPVVAALVLWPRFQGEEGEDFRILITVFLPVALTALVLLLVRSTGWSRDTANDKEGFIVRDWLPVVPAGLGIYGVSQIHLPTLVKLLLGGLLLAVAASSLPGVARWGKLLGLWVAVVVLWGFCGLAALSVGLLFVPAAFVLLALGAVYTISPR